MGLDFAGWTGDHRCLMKPETGLDERTEKRGWGLLPAGILFFLLSYVLSPGPVAKFLLNKTAGPPPIILALYAPLTRLYQHSAVAKNFYDWYMQDLWNVR